MLFMALILPAILVMAVEEVDRSPNAGGVIELLKPLMCFAKLVPNSKRTKVRGHTRKPMHVPMH